MMRTIGAIPVVCVAALIAACGSGGGGGDPPPPPANRAPIANAGADLTGTTGESLTLNGSGSSDPDGNPLSYDWTLISGPSGGGSLSDATSASARFQATMPGAYVVRLTVRDPANASASASITATITDPPAAVATVTLDRASVFLTGAGQAATLHAQVLDDEGAPVDAVVHWTSTNPDQVLVDANGLVAAVTIGSAQIFAEANGVRSQPTFVFVAQPQPGALLLTDSQIVSVGELLGLGPNDPPVLGTQYEVRVTGVAPAPTPGTVVLAAEDAPVAGKVVATRQEGELLVLTLALAPLPDLLSQYDIDWSIDLSQYPIEFEPAPAAATAKSFINRAPSARGSAAAKIRASALDALDLITCDGELTAKLADFGSTLSIDNQMRLEVHDTPGSSRHVLTGSESISGTIEFLFDPGFEASGTCLADGRIRLPVTGVLSVGVMPAVRLGIGVELGGRFEVAHGELSISGRIGSSHSIGWECTGSSNACQPIQQLTPINEFKHTEIVPSTDQMHVTLSGKAFVLLGLDLVFGTLFPVSMVEAKLGPKQTVDLGFESDQASNQIYTSKYDLVFDGTIAPGDALKTAINALLGGDGTNLTFNLNFGGDLAKSPRGSFTADRTRVPPNDPVNFTVQLEADSLNYPLLGYNVDSVVLYRKRPDDVEFAPFQTIPVTASQQGTFQYRWEPTGEDVGKSQFAAFVTTTMPVPSLEVNSNSVLEVDVTCFSPPQTQFAGTGTRASAKQAADGEVCADMWVGTSSHLILHGESVDATLTWNRDPDFDGPPSEIRYIAEGTVEFHHLVFEEAGCTVSPTVFTIGNGPEDVNSLSVDYAFTPATFAGNGEQIRDVTVSCPDQDPVTLTLGINWFSGQGEVSEDGLTIEGGITNPPASSSFRFVRP